MNTKLLTSAIAIFAALAISDAEAADLGGGLKDGPGYDRSAPSEAVNWSGIYIGGQVGYGNANHNLTLQRYNGAYCWDQVRSQLEGEGEGEKVNTTKLDDPTALHDGWNKKGEGDHATSDGEPVSGLVYGRSDDGSCDDNHGADDSLKIDPSSRNVANLDGLNSHGFIGGVQVGYDQQLDKHFVVGVFGNFNISGMKTKGSIADFDAGFDIDKGNEWSLGARVGYLATPRTMVYALAAYTQTDYKFSAHIGDEAGSKTVDFSGLSVGGGIEIALTKSVFLGGEYTHTFYGTETIFDTGASEIGGFGARIVDDLDEDKIMATLKIKFGVNQ